MTQEFGWEGEETPVALVGEPSPEEVPVRAERIVSDPSEFPSRRAIGLALVVMCSASFAHGWSAGSQTDRGAPAPPVTQVTSSPITRR